jgi:hypothetical protein
MEFCVEIILESQDPSPGCKDTCVLKRQLTVDVQRIVQTSPVDGR